MAFEIRTHSTADTRQVGEKIGFLLTSGVVFTLTGDLGSGKTAFVQGLAKGLEISDKYYINSPTYTLINEYRGRMSLVHADLYRLNTMDDVESTGLYDMADGHCVVAIEWADRLAEGDFSEYLGVHIDIIDDTARRLVIQGHGTNAKILLHTIETCFKEHKWL
jgi:tRNA threonylcarbamoyladenosine biosynthesis protein TsaE